MQIRIIFRQKTIVCTVSDFSIVNINTVIIASLESKKYFKYRKKIVRVYFNQGQHLKVLF